MATLNTSSVLAARQHGAGSSVAPPGASCGTLNAAAAGRSQPGPGSVSVTMQRRCAVRRQLGTATADNLAVTARTVLPVAVTASAVAQTLLGNWSLQVVLHTPVVLVLVQPGGWGPPLTVWVGGEGGVQPCCSQLMLAAGWQ